MTFKLMRSCKSSLMCSLVLGVAALALFAQSTSGAENDSMVTAALKKEMNRTLSKLKNSGDAPLYYTAYRVYERENVDVYGTYGALISPGSPSSTRTLDAELRVGSPRLDNSHRIPDSDGTEQTFGHEAELPVEDDELSLRNAIWLKTDSAYRIAQKRYAQVRANKDVLVPEDDRSDDFSIEKPHLYKSEKLKLVSDVSQWQKRVRELSQIFREYPAVRESYVQFEADRVKRYLVTSEGSSIEDERLIYGVRIFADSVADDGMVVWSFEEIESLEPQPLGDEKRLAAMIRRAAGSLDKLRKAPPAQPYVGPAILRGKAAAVFFHEIFGHRIEGHRQKDESEGRTFTDKVGVQIMPKFISVVDDPTAERLNKQLLNGYYRFDDEGVEAQKVVLVDHGVLKRFLMSRSPIRGFARSNGHGRCRSGYAPVARQANLMVLPDPSRQVSFAELRELLKREIKRQKKPYGLIFDEIQGGSTMTNAAEAQMFSLYPLRVTRVFADGRPDELLRGVDIVGTPLASLEYILAAGNDMQTFNGVCGAESGWIPVSASSPSLLVKTIEVARQAKLHNKPPLLPDPLHDRLTGSGTTLVPRSATPVAGPTTEKSKGSGGGR